MAIGSETLRNFKISRANLSAYISHSSPRRLYNGFFSRFYYVAGTKAFVMSNTCHTVSPSITPIFQLIIWLPPCEHRPFQNSTDCVHPTITTKLKLPRFSLFLCFLLQSFADIFIIISLHNCIGSPQGKHNFSIEKKNVTQFLAIKFQFKECKLFYSFFYIVRSAHVHATWMHPAFLGNAKKNYSRHQSISSHLL